MVSASQTMLTGLFETARFVPFWNLHPCISLVEVYRFGECMGWRFSCILTFFFLVSSRAFRGVPHTRVLGAGIPTNVYPTLKNATFSPPSNLHTFISLVELYGFEQCLSERFSPISIFFSLVSSRAFRDAPHSRFWCRDLKRCLLVFLKMVDFTLSQIYTRVFYLWKSVALDNAWVGDSRHLYSFFSRVFARLEMRHTRDFGGLTGLFEDARFGPFSNLHTCILLVEVYQFGQCLGWIFSPTSTFFSLVSSRAFRDASHPRFRCRDATFSPPPNLHTCISLVEVYWFEQCLGKIFSPISTLFSLVSTRAFRDGAHSRFWCRDLKLCLLELLKMLDLGLSQIYTRVFHLWKSVALGNTCLG